MKKFEQALVNPASVFAKPNEVVSTPALSRRQKIDVLRRWEYDARMLQMGDQEGKLDECEEFWLRSSNLYISWITGRTSTGRNRGGNQKLNCVQTAGNEIAKADDRGLKIEGLLRLATLHPRSSYRRRHRIATMP